MSFSKDRRVFLGKESIGLQALPERVRQMLLTRTDKQVFLRIDGRLNVQHQMDVFDELKAGGVRDVGIVTDAPKQ
jgi:biopolymer transport protein ExbD